MTKHVCRWANLVLVRKVDFDLFRWGTVGFVLLAWGWMLFLEAPLVFGLLVSVWGLFYLYRVIFTRFIKADLEIEEIVEKCPPAD